MSMREKLATMSVSANKMFLIISTGDQIVGTHPMIHGDFIALDIEHFFTASGSPIPRNLKRITVSTEAVIVFGEVTDGDSLEEKQEQSATAGCNDR